MSPCGPLACLHIACSLLYGTGGRTALRIVLEFKFARETRARLRQKQKHMQNVSAVQGFECSGEERRRKRAVQRHVAGEIQQGACTVQSLESMSRRRPHREFPLFRATHMLHVCITIAAPVTLRSEKDMGQHCPHVGRF